MPTTSKRQVLEQYVKNAIVMHDLGRINNELESVLLGKEQQAPRQAVITAATDQKLLDGPRKKFQRSSEVNQSAIVREAIQRGETIVVGEWVKEHEHEGVNYGGATVALRGMEKKGQVKRIAKSTYAPTGKPIPPPQGQKTVSRAAAVTAAKETEPPPKRAYNFNRHRVEGKPSTASLVRAAVQRGEIIRVKTFAERHGVTANAVMMTLMELRRANKVTQMEPGIYAPTEEREREQA